MSKKAHYLMMLMALIVLSGCQTLCGATNGAATGFGQDMQNTSDSSQNGWDSIERVDAWIRKNLW